MCKSCRNEIYDSSTGISECKCWEQMTEAEYDKYFAEEKKGCPFFKEYDKREDEYFERLGAFI